MMKQIGSKSEGRLQEESQHDRQTSWALSHPPGEDASFCEEKKEDPFAGTQGRKALPRLLERGRKRSRSRLFHQSSLGRRNRGNINIGECTGTSAFSYKS